MAIVVKLVKNEDGDEDIVFEDGAIVMVEDGAAAAVQMKERILCDQNEITASPLVKTEEHASKVPDWEGTIFDASKSKGEKEFNIRRAILATPGVSRITYWNWNQVGRELQLDFKVDTDWGELEFGETIQL